MDPDLPLVTLAEVASALGAIAALEGDQRTTVQDIAHDSRAVAPGSLFCCVPGDRHDGHRFAAEAVASGAAALLVERSLDLKVPQLVVPSVRRAMGPAAAFILGNPSAQLEIVGITGTNGKTTITYLLGSVLRAAGRATGVIGTTGARVAGYHESLERTTPEAPDLQRLLLRMTRAGVRAVAMEVSSHALAQHRVDGTRFSVGVFTNLSPDHLDYHSSMEEYFAAKAGLFSGEHAERGLANADDPWGRRLLQMAEVPMVGFGVSSEADVRAVDVAVDRSGVAFSVGRTRFRSPLLGAFNVENVLATVVAARMLGIDDETVNEGLGDATGVPGRMERVEAGQDFLVMVDYAHTPDSIRSVLRGARPLAAGRMIIVFGCGGDRDRAKRPLMGREALEGADLSFVTNDNPRSEDPRAIIDQIVEGARGGAGTLIVEPDRRAAIERAISEATDGDVVVIAGKGHEVTQVIGDREIPFDDRVVALEALRSRGFEA